MQYAVHKYTLQLIEPNSDLVSFGSVQNIQFDMIIIIMDECLLRSRPFYAHDVPVANKFDITVFFSFYDNLTKQRRFLVSSIQIVRNRKYYTKLIVSVCANVLCHSNRMQRSAFPFSTIHHYCIIISSKCDSEQQISTLAHTEFVHFFPFVIYCNILKYIKWIIW